MSSIGTHKVNAGPRRAPIETLLGELIDWRTAAMIAGPWRDLAGELAEANPFYESWTLLPALRAYAGEGVKIACVWETPARERLLALAPVEARRGYARIAVDHWAVWVHPHCFYAAPLIRRGRERAAAKAFLDLVCEGEQGRSFLRLRSTGRDGRVAAAFEDAALAGGRRFYIAGAYSRAALLAGPSPETYFANVIRAKKRKELSRLRRRLAEQGEVSVCTLSNRREIESWTEMFLALEHKGWKGEQGTSLKSSSADAAWFQESVAGAFATGRLEFSKLACGDRAIAMLVGFVAPGGAGHQVKIAHDPEFARYSPGVMIEIETTRRRLADPDFGYMDSCAAPDHLMIDRLWKDRRRIADLNISSAGAAGKAVLRLCQTLERARGALGDPHVSGTAS